jgi:hypothetical protein
VEDELAEPPQPERRALLDRFAAAFENADVAALAELLQEDVTLEMPPQLTWFTGRQTVLSFLASRVFAVLGRLRMVPRMTPFGDVGQQGIRAYAARSGQSEEEFVQQMGELLTPETAGSALVDLVLAEPATIAPGYVLTAAGLQQLP